MSHIAEDITESPTFTGERLILNVLLCEALIYLLYCFSFSLPLSAHQLGKNISIADGVPKEGLRIQDVLLRIAVLLLIRDKVKF